jgi:hypothetical protein
LVIPFSTDFFDLLWISKSLYWYLDSVVDFLFLQIPVSPNTTVVISGYQVTVIQVVQKNRHLRPVVLNQASSVLYLSVFTVLPQLFVLVCQPFGFVKPVCKPETCIFHRDRLKSFAGLLVPLPEIPNHSLGVAEIYSVISKGGINPFAFLPNNSLLRSLRTTVSLRTGLCQPGNLILFASTLPDWFTGIRY